MNYSISSLFEQSHAAIVDVNKAFLLGNTLPTVIPTGVPSTSPSSVMPSSACSATPVTYTPKNFNINLYPTTNMNINNNKLYIGGSKLFSKTNQVNYMIFETSGPNKGDLCFYTRQILDPLTYYFSPTNYTRYQCLGCYSDCPYFAIMNNGYLK